MTCVIIQWVFNLRPILVIGKRHHLAFIKVEGDAFSLFAWTDSGRETCGAADSQGHGPTSKLAGRQGFESFISSAWTPLAEAAHTTGCRQAGGRARPQGEFALPVVGIVRGTRWLVPLLSLELISGWSKGFL